MTGVPTSTSCSTQQYDVHQLTPRRWDGVTGTCLGRVIKEVIPSYDTPCPIRGQKSCAQRSRPKKMSDGDTASHDDDDVHKT
eukprot:scaffold1768_cov75-Skeletonema_dohrnii-CCMP3373.AAC.3